MIFSASLITHRRLLLLSYLTCLLFGAENLLASVVTVQTHDGRELTGQVDTKSGEEFLWIRHEEERIVLTTAVAWSSIRVAQLDGQTIEVAALIEAVPELVTEGPVAFLAHHIIDPVLEEEMLMVVPAAAHLPIIAASPTVYPRPIAGPVVAVEIEAFLVNLDRDVEPDGIEILVAAVDAQGTSVPVRGNLYARLWGDRDVGQVGRVKFEDLQRWGKPVRRADFVDGVASYSLPFRNVRPEFDWDLMPVALLNVRLGVYGEGNFEATVPVVIRQFNPFRDRMQQYERSRFFRDELSGQVRRRNSQFGRSNPGSSRWHWPR